MIDNWDSKIIQLFKDFADEDLQRRSWFEIGPEVSSPSEMCCWIDDLDLNGWLQKNEVDIGEFLAMFINDFLVEIDNLPEFTDDWRVFASIEWISIRLMASVIRDLLEKKMPQNSI